MSKCVLRKLDGKLALAAALLTHWVQDNIAFILYIFKCIFLNGIRNVFIQILLKFVAKSAINNDPARIGIDHTLAPDRQRAIIWTNDDPAFRRIRVRRPRWVKVSDPGLRRHAA